MGMGRRPLLLVSSSCMCIAMATLSLAIWKHFSIILEVAALCLFVVGVSIGFGPIVYVLNSEIYPQHWRSVGLSLAMGFCRVLSAAVSSSFLSISQYLGTAGALMLYSAIAFNGFCFIFVVVPETKGTSLEEAGVGSPGSS